MAQSDVPETSFDFKRYPKFNKTTLLSRSVWTKSFCGSNMISGKKHQNPNECCWLAPKHNNYANLTIMKNTYFLRLELKQIQIFLSKVHSQGTIVGKQWSRARILSNICNQEKRSKFLWSFLNRQTITFLSTIQSHVVIALQS